MNKVGIITTVVVAFICMLLLVAVIFVGFFPSNTNNLNGTITIDFENATWSTLGDEITGFYSGQIFQSTPNGIYDRHTAVFDLKIPYTRKENALRKYFNEFQINKIFVIYDISDYNFATPQDYNNYLNNNPRGILFDRTNFISAYILPYALTTNNISTYLDYREWLPSHFIQNGDRVPYYDITFINWYVELYARNGTLHYDIGMPQYENPYIILDFSSYQIFKGAVGGLGISVDSFNVPVFDYNIDKLGDVFGIFKYVFEFMFSWGDLLRNVVSSFFYGFVPFYFYLGG